MLQIGEIRAVIFFPYKSSFKSILMTYLSYSEKLQNPLWQKKRLEILSRDKFTCLLCGDTETTLHIHHKEYIKGNQPWEYDNDNFQTLCKYCHRATEWLKGKGYKIILWQRAVYEIDYVYFRVVVEDDSWGGKDLVLLKFYISESDIISQSQISRASVTEMDRLFTIAEKIINNG